MVASVLTFLGSLTWKVDVSLDLIKVVKTGLLELMKKRLEKRGEPVEVRKKEEEETRS